MTTVAEDIDSPHSQPDDKRRREKSGLRTVMQETTTRSGAPASTETNQFFSDVIESNYARQRLSKTAANYALVEAHQKQDAKGAGWGEIAAHPMFEGCTLFVITLNAVWIGVDQDFNDAPELRLARLLFIIVENFFCYYFTFEVVIRFLAFKKKCQCFRDAWFRFDGILVVLMIVETWIFPIVMPESGESGGSGLKNLTMLRLLRLLRLARISRLMRAVPSLFILLKGMKAAARSVITTLVLLVIFLYVLGIVFVMFLGKRPEFREVYGSLPLAMNNLFLGGTLLDDVTDVLANFKDSGDLTPKIFLYVMFFFVLVSSFTILNMLIGILCEVAQRTKDAETESADWDVATELLTASFKSLDEDGSGMISKKEFSIMNEKPAVKDAFEILDISAEHLLQLSDAIFEPDDDAKDKELSFTDFLDVIWSNRPGTSASVLDLHQMQATLRTNANRVTKIIDRLEHCVGDQESDLLGSDSVESMLEQKLKDSTIENDLLSDKLEKLKRKLSDLVAENPD